ncbi:methyltransferase domain-containing protein [Marinobacter sp. DSM 26671]|jgi:SAM-dependent methyltransferase|uniref:methyltransferase domain-containing protein n=1 Tax=Marinobacter sp. DSM 26671 TaxID=1761793 RepID=UPI000B811776|nr:methyltransferase domain-containing protein [Marinobacter sp. DSM 26671]
MGNILVQIVVLSPSQCTELYLRHAAYRLIHRFLNPVLPDSRLSTFFRWKSALTLVGTEFHGENLRRNRAKLERLFDPKMALQPELARLLPNDSNALYKVLDVGAGPISKVGKIADGSPIDLIPVDPLADDYKQLLAKNDLLPPVPTRKGYGERLSEQFPENSFDLIHARNSVDHCLDPVVVILNCVRVLKPGCHFYLNHYRNEGIAADYYGLHQWNFDLLDGQFVVSDRFGKVISISSALEGMAHVTSVESQGDRIIVVIQKTEL